MGPHGSFMVAPLFNDEAAKSRYGAQRVAQGSPKGRAHRKKKHVFLALAPGAGPWRWPLALVPGAGSWRWLLALAPGLGTLTMGSNPGTQAIGSWARYLGLGTQA